MNAQLPHRRRSIAGEIIWEGSPITLRAGLMPDDCIAELFIHPGGNMGKSGSAFHELCAELAILISHHLQSGRSVSDVRRMFGRLDSGEPASIAGAAMDWLFRIESEMRPETVRLWDQA